MRPIFSFDIYICMYLLENQELSEKDSSFPGRVLEMLKWFHLCNGGLRDGSLRGVGRRNRRTRRQEMGRTKVARLSKSNIHIIPYKVDRKPGDPRWPASRGPTTTLSPQQAGHMLVRKGQTQHRNRGRFCETTLDEHCTSTPSLAFSTSAVKGCSALTLNH